MAKPDEVPDVPPAEIASEGKAAASGADGRLTSGGIRPPTQAAAKLSSRSRAFCWSLTRLRCGPPATGQRVLVGQVLVWVTVTRSLRRVLEAIGDATEQIIGAPPATGIRASKHSAKIRR